MRLLYLQPNPQPPPSDTSMDRFFLLSGEVEGEVLQPVWYCEPEELECVLGLGSWVHYQSGRFRYHWLLAWKWTGLRRSLHIFWFYILEAKRAHRERAIQCVVAYSHMTTALCGIAIKLMTGAKLVVEVLTSPNCSFVDNQPRRRIVDHLWRFYSDLCLHVSLWSCDCAHLLYPGQLQPYPMLRRVRTVVFHDFVPVSAVPRHIPGAERYIALVGAPWYLKGADLAIAAFRRLAPEFPGVGLKILGHYPDRDALETLATGLDRVQILPAIPYKEALAFISSATVLVLASRCEGLPRVVIEAMAAGVPVVAANVGGIASLVRNGDNGLLFPKADACALERCLRQLLSDKGLRERMGLRGSEIARSEFSEAVYIRRFVAMTQAALAE